MLRSPPSPRPRADRSYMAVAALFGVLLVCSLIVQTLHIVRITKAPGPAKAEDTSTLGWSDWARSHLPDMFFTTNEDNTPNYQIDSALRSPLATMSGSPSNDPQARSIIDALTKSSTKATDTVLPSAPKPVDTSATGQAASSSSTSSPSSSSSSTTGSVTAPNGTAGSPSTTSDQAATSQPTQQQQQQQQQGGQASSSQPSSASTLPSTESKPEMSDQTLLKQQSQPTPTAPGSVSTDGTGMAKVSTPTAPSTPPPSPLQSTIATPPSTPSAPVASSSAQSGASVSTTTAVADQSSAKTASNPSAAMPTLTAAASDNNNNNNQQQGTGASLTKRTWPNTKGGIVMKEADPWSLVNDKLAFHLLQYRLWSAFFDNNRTTDQWRTFVSSVQTTIPYPGTKLFNGKGIVTAARSRYFASVLINIKVLRRVGCKLPVELWHIDTEIFDGSIRTELEKMDVTFRSISASIAQDFTDFMSQEQVQLPKLPKAEIAGYGFKPFAIIFSRFEEVIFLDADTFMVKDPAYLLDNPHYKKTGAMFWPDFWPWKEKAPIWDIIGKRPDFSLMYTDKIDPDSGAIDHTMCSAQMLINKRRHWTSLLLASFFNVHRSLYYPAIYFDNAKGKGDKDTFMIGWYALNAPFHFVQHHVAAGGSLDKMGKMKGVAMIQHDPDGKVLLVHDNLIKFKIPKEESRRIARFWHKYSRKWPAYQKWMDRAEIKKGATMFQIDRQWFTRLLGGEVKTMEEVIGFDFERDIVFPSWVDVSYSKAIADDLKKY